MSAWAGRRPLASAAGALPATVRQDPAVAGHFRGGGPDSRAVRVPGVDHGVGLADLSPADRTAAEDMPVRWAGQEYFTHTLGT
ncbi:hypothetical protein OR263_17315 [Streptomyces sp. NEAU-H22]|uniref:hypothetical protein n=1 Tax=unclassified Streptomyces TaxID=2593676 RepID=UPI00225984CA|nr:MULTISPECIES: hypothetical protein [unclassified Streptomyces]MCX3288444.1 hypothetical protein [Streptomyces sp. NEAU-H22]WMD08387.1 hypothetical protein Q7C01_30185 [Streptomyces sp. FXY-T5]